MRLTLLASALLAVFTLGCQSEGPVSPSPSSPPSPAPSTPEPEPQTSPTTKKATNPDRLYQLADLEKGTIKVNGKPVPIWLMDDDGKRQEGMMFLKDDEVKASEGMLFVFPYDQGPEHGFWMRNTRLPLDIIYISKEFKVVGMVKAKPFDETSRPAGVSFQYVLELKQGQADTLKIKKGSPVEIPVSLRKTRV